MTTSSAAIGPLLIRIDVLTNKISSSGSWVIGACSPSRLLWKQQDCASPQAAEDHIQCVCTLHPKQHLMNTKTCTRSVALHVQRGVGNIKVQPKVHFILGNFCSLKLYFAVRKNSL